MNVTDNKVGTMVGYIRTSLSGAYPESEVREITFLLFQHYLGFSRTDMVLKRDESLSESELLKFIFAIKELKKHKPIQYILGSSEFYGLKFHVDPAVLIPRPETEELVDWIIKDARKKEGEIKVLDIGTGSGCIAVTLKKNLSQAKVTALDMEEKALEVAQANALLNNVQIEFANADILNANKDISGPFDIIVSNPPYIPESDRNEMESNVLNYEPSSALFVPDNDPLIFYKRIAAFAEKNLTKPGLLYFETHEKYASALKNYFKHENTIDIEIRKDINGKERMMRIVYK